MLVSVTHLRQSARDELSPPEGYDLGARLVQQVSPAPALAKFLYRRIGRPFGWSSRADWTDDQWAQALAGADTEFWVSWQHGQLTGFAELRLGMAPDQTTTYIKYLGLLPEHCGLGLGGHLVTQVTRRAWTVHGRVPSLPTVRTVALDTSELDSPHALPNYLARGFRIERVTCEHRAVDLTITDDERSTTAP